MQTYTTHFKSLEEMENHVGKELGVSKWTTISQETINTFATITEDEQWIHVDPTRCAAESPYKVPVAHGFLVLSFASSFCYQTYQIEGIKMGLNYGLDKVRFMNATPVNAALRGRTSLLNFEKIEGGAKFKIKCVFEIKGQEKPACVAEFLGMVYV